MQTKSTRVAKYTKVLINLLEKVSDFQGRALNREHHVRCTRGQASHGQGGVEELRSSSCSPEHEIPFLLFVFLLPVFFRTRVCQWSEPPRFSARRLFFFAIILLCGSLEATEESRSFGSQKCSYRVAPQGAKRLALHETAMQSLYPPYA